MVIFHGTPCNLYNMQLGSSFFKVEKKIMIKRRPIFYVRLGVEKKKEY